MSSQFWRISTPVCAGETQNCTEPRDFVVAPLPGAPAKRLDKIQKIILIGGQEVGRTGGVDGLASLRRKRLLTGVHIHPKVFVMVAMDRRLVSVMMTMVGEQLIKLR